MAFTGTIIYLSKAFGLLRSEDAKGIFFFLRQMADETIEKLQVLDTVVFNRKEDTDIATDVSKSHYLPPAPSVQRYIGIIADWNGRFGHIRTSMLEKYTFLFSGRLRNPSIRKGKTVIFRPVRFAEDDPIFYADFAYTLDEEDPEHLLNLYIDNPAPEVKRSLELLHPGFVEKVKPEDVLKKALHEGKPDMNELARVIKRLKENFEYATDQNMLCNHLDKEQLYGLLERRVIQSLEKPILRSYFDHLLKYKNNGHHTSKNGVIAHNGIPFYQGEKEELTGLSKGKLDHFLKQIEISPDIVDDNLQRLISRVATIKREN